MKLYCPKCKAEINPEEPMWLEPLDIDEKPYTMNTCYLETGVSWDGVHQDYDGDLPLFTCSSCKTSFTVLE